MGMKTTGSATILLAEDDLTYGSALTDLLQREGHAVRHVLDGEEAVACIQEMGERLDLLICDLLLPRRTGFEVIKEVVAMDLALPILAMTGIYRDFREIHALRGLGVKGYLQKSSPFEHILFRVNNLLFPSRDNQRGHYRVAASIPVQFRLGDWICYGTTYNLSSSGVYVRTPEPILDGSVVEMALGLPTAVEMVTVHAEVVHSATAAEVRGTAYPAGFGARFLEPSPLAAAAVRRFVEIVHARESEADGFATELEAFQVAGMPAIGAADESAREDEDVPALAPEPVEVA